MTEQTSNFCFGVLAKEPQPGKVKTRLAMELGDETAAELYGAWLQGFFDRLHQSPVPWVLFVDPAGSENRFRDRYGLDNVPIVDQPDGDLGNRMAFVQQWIREERDDDPVLLGSDAPDVPLRWIRAGMRRLRDDEVLIGPATDGGYYCLGSREVTPELFHDMRWSRRNVLRRTLNRAELSNRGAFLLPDWQDVDTLPDWRDFLNRMDSYWEPYLEDQLVNEKEQPDQQ